MKQKNFKKTTLAVLFIYIIIFTTATEPTINRIGLFVVLGCGMLYCMTNGVTVKNNALLGSLILYGVILFFAKLYSTAPVSKVNTVFIGYISMLIVAFVVILVVECEDDIKFLLKAFVVSALVQFIYMLSIYGVDIISVIVESENSIRVGDEVSNSNSVGISFAIGYIISLYFLLNEKMLNYKKLFYIAIVIITFTFGLLSASRKVLLLLLLGTFAIVSLKSSGKNAIKSVFGVLFAAVIVFALYSLISYNSLFSTASDRFMSLIDGLRGTGELDQSAETRFEMIEIGWKVFKENPLVGKGLYTSYNYFNTYSHNNFIEILMNTGIVGFVIFYFPYLIALKEFIKIDKTKKLYPVMLVLFLWTFLGGYGMVNYYSKDAMTLMALISLWLYMQRSNKYEEIT